MDITAIRLDNLNRLLHAQGEKGRHLTMVADTVGLNRSLLSQHRHGKKMGDSVARRIEEGLGLEFGWMDQWHGDGGEGGRNTAFRTVPLIGYVEAGTWTDSTDAYPRGDGIDRLPIDVDLAARLSPVAFALEIEGESMMSPDGTGFSPGDRIIIDPRINPRPGDFVVAKIDTESKATFKRYRDRGSDITGTKIAHLVPLNPDYPTLVIDGDNPGRVVGVMIEHRRRRSL